MRRKGHVLKHRVYGPTLTFWILEAAARQGITVGIYGAAPDVLAALLTNIRRKFPNLNIAYSHSSPYRKLTPEEDAAKYIDQSLHQVIHIPFMGTIYRTRTFTRWMRKAGLTDEILCQAVLEISQGLIEACLGGNLLKKRIALPGRGKRGSTRTIVATNHENRWIYYLDLKRATVPISRILNSKPCKSWPVNTWL